MNNLLVIKNYLDKNNIANTFEELPDGEQGLTFDMQMEDEHWFVIKQIENTNILRIYTVLTIASPKAKYNVCRYINDYNRKCKYLQFFFQESEQGTFVYVSYTMPSINVGIEYFFRRVLNAFVSQLDTLLIPYMLFQGDVDSWFWSD